MAGLDWITARPVAHRGLHDRARGILENTRAAVAAAVERGYAVEIDVQPARDGTPIVFHDDTLDRLTVETGAVAARAPAELSRIRLRDVEETIPTLAQILTTIAGRTPLFIEIKSERRSDRALEARVAETLVSYAGPVAVMSFDPDSVAAMRAFAPALPRGLVSCYYPANDWPDLDAGARRARRHLASAWRTMPHFVAYNVNDLPALAPLIMRVVFGLPVLTWTVRTPAQRRIAARYASQMIFEGFVP